jgi:rapamycin-insensitive companion of mTOR
MGSLRFRHPRYFSSITLFHRALCVISTNHFQAPVRRFIMDLFDVKIEPDTLIQLRHLENPTSAPLLSPMKRLALGQPDASSAGPRLSPLSPMRRVQTEVLADEDDLDAHEGRRRRSASSPGPEPPGRLGRARGLTISEVG